MRSILVALIVMVIASAAGGFDLGGRRGEKAPRDWPVNVPVEGRQGGDTIADAVVIPSIPYETTGITTGFNNDYDEACPYSTSTAPDVVYAFTPPAAMEIDIDMLGSLYDTKIYLYDVNLALVACNDDYYADYVSALFDVPVVPAGAPYYLVIDGYGSEHGEYSVFVGEWVWEQPCDLVIDEYDIIQENEPPLVDDYEDATNGGCNSPQFGNPFENFFPSFPFAGLAFGGRSGWYTHFGSNYRDTDWFTAELDVNGHLEMEIDAEVASNFFQLGPLDCDDVEVIQAVIGGPCNPVTMTIDGEPFEQVWLGVSPTTFVPPADWQESEYEYLLRIVAYECARLHLNSDDDYTFPAPTLEWWRTRFFVSPASTDADDVDLSELCDGDPTPGPDYFAQVYLGVDGTVSGWLLENWIEPVAAYQADRSPWPCLALVSDLRAPEVTCLGSVCATHYNQLFSLGPAVEAGWYWLVADYTVSDPASGWASIWADTTSPPPAPSHDTCAGAIPIAHGPIAITDDLTACTNAVDQGRDGCGGDFDLAYTSRDAIYRIDFTHGDILDVTMLGAGDWDEALYLVRDCEAPLGACVAAAQPAGDGVHLTYTALDDETLWLICDSWDVGDRPFTLTGSLDNTTDAPPFAPAQLALRAAPNPFNPTTTITYDIPRATHTRLRIHDLAGRLVATLVDAPREPGHHTATWRAESPRGSTLPSGSYLVRLEAAGEVVTTRLTLLK